MKKNKLIWKMTRNGLLGLLVFCSVVFLSIAKESPAQNVYKIPMHIATPNKTNLEKLIGKIEDKTALRISYSKSKIDLKKEILLPDDIESVGGLLEVASAQTGYGFKQINNNIIILNPPSKMNNEILTGEINGRIFDVSNGEPLVGVTIRVETETGVIGTVTDINGSYRLQNIPNGEQVIVISYMGYETSSLNVNIDPERSQNLSVRLKPSLGEMNEVTIIGFRKGQSRALNLQKEAFNLKNIVSYEQIERFPDLNVTEALKRVPGVVTEPQRGEAQSVLIRGLSSSFHTVTLNGQRVASTGESDRETNTAIIPIGMISSMEVVKSVTADMDADATSGSINLLTTRPVGDSILVKATLASGYNNMSGQPQYLGAATISKRIGKFDYVLSATYQLDNRATEDIRHDWGVQDFGNGPEDVLAGLRPSFYETRRQRIGIGGQADYNFSDRSSVYLRAVYNNYDEYEIRNDARYGLDAGTFTAPGQVSRGRYEKVIREYNRITNLISINAGGQQDIGSATLDYNVGYSHGTFSVPLREYYAFRHSGRPNFNYDISSRKFATVEVSNDIDISNMDQMAFRYYERRRDEVNDTDKFANFNLKIPYSLGSGRGYFKTGAKIWQKVKEREMLEQRWTLFDGTLNMSQFFQPNERQLIDGRYPINGQIDWVAGKQFFESNISRFTEDTDRTRELSDPNNYRAQETIIGKYIMTDFTINKLSTNFGLRGEHVTNNYQGNEVLFDGAGNYSETQRTESGNISYFKLFPMMNLRYAVNNNTNIRFAYTNTIARPMFSDLVPFRIINQDNQIISTGNPDLMPSTAHNFDLMYESYFKSLGIVSAGIYYKSLDNFIYNETTFIQDGGQFNGYQLVTPLNGESAFVYGLELAIQRKFDFLPGFFSDFGIYANYTYSQSEARIIVPVSRRIALPLQTPHVYNIALQYDKNGFSAQISYNWRATWLDSVGGSVSAPSIQERGEIFLDRFFEGFGQLDFTASQRVSRNFTAFMNLNNLTNSSHRHYFGTTIYPYRDSYHSFWGHLGLRFNL
ncbi:TonB-dependent receptor [Belliella kenyensis]|uniref:TonB-dependent receptor n=1 Tax=Belliella kenyensis TaxID=1472724 RepID=A0ABV8EIW6_9BACT|nr:TonB-dependent receptor [Belliella kenyensis]MCH7400302.1 TonB-dependent receptor [Belliella kenyensis]MDN3604680.1 TonB-dependent receptor [Belliella kenyensis]